MVVKSIDLKQQELYVCKGAGPAAQFCFNKHVKLGQCEHSKLLSLLIKA